MKPTLEEILNILRSVCDLDKVDPLIPAGDMVVVTPKELERFALAMYRRGAEDMRERAAEICDKISEVPRDPEYSAGAHYCGHAIRNQGDE